MKNLKIIISAILLMTSIETMPVMRYLLRRMPFTSIRTQFNHASTKDEKDSLRQSPERPDLTNGVKPRVTLEQQPNQNYFNQFIYYKIVKMTTLITFITKIFTFNDSHEDEKVDIAEDKKE